MYTVSDFDFELPPELIASRPLEQRDASRMIVVRGRVNEDKHICDFLDYLRPGDVVVFNNSRVIPARFIADGKYEITLHTATTDGCWWAHITASPGFASKRKRRKYRDASDRRQHSSLRDRYKR